MSAPTDQEKKDELAFDLIKRRYDATLSISTELDTKAANLIGHVSIVTGLIIGLGTFSILDKLADPSRSIPYFVGIGLLVASIISSLLAVRIMSWLETPELLWLRGLLIDSDFKHKTMLRQVGARMTKAVERNRLNNAQKGKLISASWYFVVAGLLVLLIYLGVFVSSGGLEAGTSGNQTAT